MATLKLSGFDTAPDLIDVDFFIGVRDNGDGTFSNYKYTYAQVAALASGATQVRITVGADGSTITNSFFSTNTITKIFTNNQVYLSDVDFTQSGDTITGVTISFYETQVLIASI
jgi:hypothetical protein